MTAVDPAREERNERAAARAARAARNARADDCRWFGVGNLAVAGAWALANAPHAAVAHSVFALAAFVAAIAIRNGR